MAEEMAAHLEMQEEANRVAGMSAVDARYAAQRQFGGVAQVQERCREQRGWVWLEQLAKDFRLAGRTLARSPGFTAVAVLLLALGVGGNTVVFSLVNGLYLKPLPFPESERLVDLDETAPQWNLRYTSINYHDFAAWREQNQTFAGMAAWQGASFNLVAGQITARVQGQRVSHDLAAVFGFRPVLGRMFTAAEEFGGGAKVALLGDHAWRELFGGDPAVVGKSIVLDSEAYEVIGVLPPSAVFPSRAAVWIPFPAKPNNYSLQGIGRLKPGVTLAQAAADLLRIHRARIPESSSNSITSPIIQPLLQRYLGDGRIVAVVLTGAVVVLLLIACANVAGLMLARTLGRAPELGLRAALGATRFHILRQILTESLVLTLFGGAAGVLLGRWLLAGPLAVLVTQMPAWINVEMDRSFLVFVGLLVGLCTAVAGLVPARHILSRLDLNGVLGSGARQFTTPSGRVRSLRVLVVAELSLAMMLLLVAGFMGRAFLRVQRVDPGLRPEQVLAYGLVLPEAKYRDHASRIAFFEQHLERLRALPEVELASASTALPFSGEHCGNFLEPEGERPGGPNAPLPVILTRSTFPRYFETMGIPLMVGRSFEERDGPGVIIVNQTLARLYWPGQSALGRRLRFGSESPWAEVIGIAHDVRHYGVEAEIRPGVYVPYRMDPQLSVGLVIRTKGDPAALAPVVQSLVHEQDATLSLTGLNTMEERIRQSLFQRRMYSTMTTTFALIAAAMAATGLYGIVAYVGGRRMHEFGIRLALGAQTQDLRRLVLCEALGLARVGIGLGLVGGLLSAGALRTLLMGVNLFDPIVLGGITGLLTAIVLAACLIPARRAMRVEIVDVLRAE